MEREKLIKTSEKLLEVSKALNRLKRVYMVMKTLRRLGIKSEVIEHDEIVTCEESKVFYDKYGYYESTYTLCKNILVRDKKGKNFFLVILPMDKEIDMELLREILGTTKLGLATNENLLELLDTERGSVSLFSIINDYQKKVRIILDEDIFDKKLLAFHPNYNGMTLMINREDAYYFIKKSGNPYAVLMSSLIEKQKKEMICKVKEIARTCVV